VVEEAPQRLDHRRAGKLGAGLFDVPEVLTTARVRAVRRGDEAERALHAVSLHLGNGVAEERRPVAVAKVDRQVDAVALQLLVDSRDERTVLIVDRAFSAEVMVVLSHRLEPFARYAAPARYVLQERHDVLRALGAAERHEQQSIVDWHLVSLFL
jgi:hypothetical protein